MAELSEFQKDLVRMLVTRLIGARWQRAMLLIALHRADVSYGHDFADPKILADAVLDTLPPRMRGEHVD